jgi:hypothetical protein
LTNLQCGTARLSDDSGAAHEGMLSAARELAAGQVGAAIAALIESHPEYQLRVTGHSQGAGVAALLVHHWQRRYPNIRGYVFAPPCVLTLAAAKALGPRLTSVVYGDDIIPRLSLGSVEDLRNASAALASEPRLCDRIHAAIGSDFPDLDDVVSPVAEPIDGEADAQRLWMMSIRSTLFAVMQAEKLYCPGRILWIPAKLGSDGTVAPAGTFARSMHHAIRDTGFWNGCSLSPPMAMFSSPRRHMPFHSCRWILAGPPMFDQAVSQSALSSGLTPSRLSHISQCGLPGSLWQ